MLFLHLLHIMTVQGHTLKGAKRVIVPLSCLRHWLVRQNSEAGPIFLITLNQVSYITGGHFGSWARAECFAEVSLYDKTVHSNNYYYQSLELKIIKSNRYGLTADHYM